MQVAWLHGLMDFVFPYLVQFLKQYSTSVDTLMAERKEVRTWQPACNAVAFLKLLCSHSSLLNAPYLVIRPIRSRACPPLQ